MPKRELNGAEIAGFIKERQTIQIRSMNQPPVLAVVRTNPDPVTDVYLRIKTNYAQEIGAQVKIIDTTDTDAESVIHELNTDPRVDGIIVQLPLVNPDYTDRVLNSVLPQKDVDGLGKDTLLDPATPMAILWLLAGYNVDIANKKVLVIGQGRLVGAPLMKMLENSGVQATVADEHTTNLAELCLDAEVIITAAGQPRLITSDMVQPNTVVIDAGTSTDRGEVVGDVDDSLRARDDVMITPKKGGVGPLTVAALFDNLLRVVPQ